MNNLETVKPTINFFGATGDLAKKAFPAFYNLYLDGRMPEKFKIIALGRAKAAMIYRSHVSDNLTAFSRNKIASKRNLSNLPLISAIYRMI
jgi:glucose-6-phosphate 1-dehydrogenase